MGLVLRCQPHVNQHAAPTGCSTALLGGSGPPGSAESHRSANKEANTVSAPGQVASAVFSPDPTSPPLDGTPTEPASDFLDSLLPADTQTRGAL